MEHLGLGDWKDFDGISYKKLPYTPEIIKAELINRHSDDILVGNSESQRPINWSKILLAIIVTFESLQCSTECLFPLIRKAAATIHITLPQSQGSQSYDQYLWFCGSYL